MRGAPRCRYEIQRQSWLNLGGARTKRKKLNLGGDPRGPKDEAHEDLRRTPSEIHLRSAGGRGRLAEVNTSWQAVHSPPH